MMHLLWLLSALEMGHRSKIFIVATCVLTFRSPYQLAECIRYTSSIHVLCFDIYHDILFLVYSTIHHIHMSFCHQALIVCTCACVCVCVCVCVCAPFYLNKQLMKASCLPVFGEKQTYQVHCFLVNIYKLNIIGINSWIFHGYFRCFSVKIISNMNINYTRTVQWWPCWPDLGHVYLSLWPWPWINCLGQKGSKSDQMAWLIVAQ